MSGRSAARSSPSPAGATARRLAVTFKCSEMAFDILKDQPGLRPAPYLASRGMTWIQRQTGESMDDDALKDYLRESHRLVVAEADRGRLRKEIGLCGLSDIKCGSGF